jgi:hypothetical protein
VDCVQMDEWPNAGQVPSTKDLPLGGVIAESWSHRFKTLNELRQAVACSISEEPATS